MLPVATLQDKRRVVEGHSHRDELLEYIKCEGNVRV